MRSISPVAAVGISLLVVLNAQAPPQPRTEFEVASVKTNRSGIPGGMVEIRADGFDATNETLRQLIMAAYGVQDSRIVGGPDWMASDRFDIRARAAGEAPRAQLMTMLQALLAGRFHLIVRRETREFPIYELVVDTADSKPGLRSAVAGACADRGNIPTGPVPAGSLPSCGILSAGPGRMSGRSVPMTLLATILAPRVARPVVDRTDRSAKFDLDLTWTPEDPRAPAGGNGTADDGPPGIFTAVREQLGLRLRPAQGPVEVIVVSSVEHPTEN